jgi:hypothetical protein
MLTKTRDIAVIEKPASVATELELTLEDLKILAGIYESPYDSPVPDIKNQPAGCFTPYEECTRPSQCCSNYCDPEIHICL